MRLLMRIAGWVLALVLLVVVVGGGGGYLWLRRSLPQTTGEIQVRGIGGPVTIVRDSDGVAHISGTTETDVAFGLGFVHAQERLWQMEVQRRIGHARLSEVFGETTLRTDKFLRTLGVARAARSTLAKFDNETLAILEAYAAGVNAFLATNPVLPPEFLILGVQPEPWQPIDSLVWAKMMAWDLGGNWSDEVLRALLIAKVGPEDANVLMQTYTADGPLILPEGVSTLETAGHPNPPIQPATAQALLDLWETIHLTTGLGDLLSGSNNWVIGGSRTASGKPLLVNDPHLGNRIPSIWYLAHMQGGRINAIGATFPGLPAIVIGHNERIAWGVTNTGPDVQDLYIERIDAQNDVEYNGQREPATLINEVIRVKGADPITLTVRITRHGPIISDVQSDLPDTLAFRWTALDDDDLTMRAFLNINRAQNWEEFVAALRDYKTPMQNFVYADVDGNIGYYAPGAVPIRRNGDGRAPVPGWTDEYEWIGYIPFEELPHIYNPPKDYVATANNKVVGDDYPYLLGTSWAAPFRAQRIIELIEQGNKLTVDDMRAMLGDVVSAQARELLPIFRNVTPAGEREAAALELLRSWDGAMHGDSAAAAVYQGYYYAALEAIFADELRDLFSTTYRNRRDFPALALRAVLLDGQREWCDDVTTIGVKEDCPATLAKALSNGLTTMAAVQGESDPARWRWDRVHQAVFPHNPFSQVGALRGLFERRTPNGGDTFTINVAPVRITEPYLQYNAPSYRQIIDLSDLDNSRFMHTTGQSGNVLSSRYSDFLDRWQQVEDIPMRFSSAIDGETLVLHPIP
ncbi:penicillin acylase family protein [uncultured Chloroflexus sp.]|uniref:penicillin acylase family protein n=1 Tax=uncultured Chloroflexus sp. TaxID=214040 RepID=UPI00261F02DD|nr:penicillin acylase family protein [uncultured Chloroflexus sp.]